MTCFDIYVECFIVLFMMNTLLHNSQIEYLRGFSLGAVRSNSASLVYHPLGFMCELKVSFVSHKWWHEMFSHCEGVYP